MFELAKVLPSMPDNQSSILEPIWCKDIVDSGKWFFVPTRAPEHAYPTTTTQFTPACIHSPPLNCKKHTYTIHTSHLHISHPHLPLPLSLLPSVLLPSQKLNGCIIVKKNEVRLFPGWSMRFNQLQEHLLNQFIRLCLKKTM